MDDPRGLPIGEEETAGGCSRSISAATPASRFPLQQKAKIIDRLLDRGPYQDDQEFVSVLEEISDGATLLGGVTLPAHAVAAFAKELAREWKE